MFSWSSECEHKNDHTINLQIIPWQLPFKSILLIEITQLSFDFAYLYLASEMNAKTDDYTYRKLIRPSSRECHLA